MSNWRKLILILPCFAMVFAMNAQPQNTLELEPLMEIKAHVETTASKLMNMSVPLNLTKQPLSGTYLNSDWSPAVVFTKSNELLSCLGRYNIPKEKMEIKINGQVRTLQVYKIDGIYLGDELFIPLSSNEKNDGNKPVFYKVLSGGETSLLLKYRVTLHTIGSSSLFNNIGTKREYRTSDRLYYCLVGQKPDKLKKGKKKILNLLNQKSVELEAFADKNDVGYKKESDLITLFDHYNELMK